MNRPGWRGRALEGAAWLLEAAIGFGLVSCAAVAAMLGKLWLGGLLAALAVGVAVRFGRRRSDLSSRKR